MNEETAEVIALKAVAYIVGNDDLKDRFMALSGMDASDIKASVGEPVFLSNMVEFLVNHEPDLIAFAADQNISPSSVTQAWRTLGGGTGQDW